MPNCAPTPMSLRMTYQRVAKAVQRDQCQTKAAQNRELRSCAAASRSLGAESRGQAAESRNTQLLQVETTSQVERKIEATAMAQYDLHPREKHSNQICPFQRLRRLVQIMPSSARKAMGPSENNQTATSAIQDVSFQRGTAWNPGRRATSQA